MDALEYLHGLQLVHHDLKADNILITRNGANVKLIDFGLSATDATLSPVPNDPRADIRSLGKLLPALLPKQRLMARRCLQDKYANITAVRQALTRRQHIVRLLPIILSAVLLMIAAVLFYFSLSEKNDEQQRYEAMIATVDRHMAYERKQLAELAGRDCTFDPHDATEMIAYVAYINEYTAIRNHQWTVRDSLIATYPANDPLREHLFQRWTNKETELDNEFYPQLTGKLKN